MRRLRRLCEATRAISPHAELKFRGVPDREDIWVVQVLVGQAVLVETGAGTLESVVAEAASKLQSFSQRILSASTANENEPPSEDK